MKRILHLSIIVVLTVVFLFLFFRNSDAGRVWSLVRSAHVGWLLCGFAANFLALVCRAERWRTILDPDHRPAFYPTFFATALGFMTSTILPIRAGDVVRPALLARRTNIRFSAALGTVLTERVLDLMSILTLFLIFVGTSGRHFATDPSTSRHFVYIKTAAIAAGAGVILLGGFVVALFFSREFVRRVHGRLARLLPVRFHDSWMNFFDSFVASLDIASHPTALVRVVLTTAAIWIFLCSQFFFVVQALGHPLPFTSSFFVTGMTIVGLMIPTPGGVGGFHKACQIALTNFYGFSIDSSVAVALLFHLVGVLPVIVTGTILFLREGLSWKQLSRISENRQE